VRKKKKKEKKRRQAKTLSIGSEASTSFSISVEFFLGFLV